MESPVSTEAHEPPAYDALGSGATEKAATEKDLTLTDEKEFFAGVPVLKGVSFSVPAGQVVGLIGEKGVGKFTSLSAW